MLDRPSSQTVQPPLLAMQGVRKTFANGLLALDGITLTLPGEPQFLAVLGPSGCGKSTMLRIAADLDAPSAGSIDWPAFDRAGEHGGGLNLGYVFQEPTLMPWATIFDNVRLPLRIRGLSGSGVSDRVMEMLGRVGLREFARSYPRELSGGMRMRASVARALVTEPRLLLMDEPFAALDEITRARLERDLLGLWLSTPVYDCLRHAQRLRSRLSREPRHRHDAAPRPHRGRSENRRALSPHRGVPHVHLLYCAVPRGFGSPGAGDERGAVMRIGLGFDAVAPIAVGALFIGLWQAAVQWYELPPYLLPSPLLIAETLVSDFPTLLPSWLFTLKITVLAFLAAAIGGLGLSLLLTSSRLLERSLFPYAVILQVTPIVAIAPLIIIWAKDTALALLICAWIVAFFPVVSNTMTGLNSTDPNLRDLFKLYGASKWQTMLWLRLPSALPYFLAGLRISGGLALIGAVVAEFVAGTGGTESGLAYRILESAYRLRIPRVFAALVLISATGLAIFAVLSLLSNRLLRHWHESSKP